MLVAAKARGRGAGAALGHGLAVPARDLCRHAPGERLHPEHVAQGQLIDNGATEQVFGHIKDEFFRGRDWDTFEGFKRDLEAYIRHWNNVRRQKKLEGLTPAEFRNQALREAA